MTEVKRKGRSRLTLLLVAIGIAGVALYGTHIYRSRVPLGTWVGTFTTPGGHQGVLMLTVLERKSVGEQGINGELGFVGSAQLCIAGQAERYFSVRGWTDLRGPGFDPGLIFARGGDGLSFVDLRGARRSGRLAMTSLLARYRQGAGIYSPRDADSTTATEFAMVRDDGRRFVKACRAVGAKTP